MKNEAKLLSDREQEECVSARDSYMKQTERLSDNNKETSKEEEDTVHELYILTEGSKSIDRTMDSIGGADGLRNILEGISLEDKSKILAKLKEEYEQSVRIREANITDIKDQLSLSHLALNPLKQIEFLVDSQNGFLPVAALFLLDTTGVAPVAGALSGVYNSARLLNEKIRMNQERRKHEKILQSVEKKSFKEKVDAHTEELHELAISLGSDETKSNLVIEKYEHGANHLAWLKEQADVKKRRVCAAMAGIIMGTLSADTWYGSEHFKETKFANEIVPETTIGKYVESGKETAWNDENEDLVFLADGKPVNLEIERNSGSAGPKDIGPILDLIQEKKAITLNMMHTHPGAFEDAVKELEKTDFQKRLSEMYFKGPTIMDVATAKKASSHHHENKSESQSIPPSSTDIITNFLLGAIERNYGMQPQEDYVFGGSGVWRYSVDYSHPVWHKFSLDMQNKALPHDDASFQKAMEDMSYVQWNFFADYQAEMLRTMTTDFAAGNHFGIIRSIIENARSKYGVVLDYASYDTIKAVGNFQKE